MTPQPPCRIDGILAAEANQVVLFRRGPSKLTQLLVWDFETDRIQAGQWLKGRVYTRRCDVSPDGKHLVLCATNYRDPRTRNGQVGLCGWTALTHPPYYTAIGLWFSGCAWNGGGLWESNQSLLLNEFPFAWEQAKPAPKGIEVRPLGLGCSEDEPLFTMRLQARGWTQIRGTYLKASVQSFRQEDALPFDVHLLIKLGLGKRWVAQLRDEIPRWREQMGVVMVKPFPGGCLMRETQRWDDTWFITDHEGKVIRQWRSNDQWVDVNAQGHILFAEEGCLYRWKHFPMGAPTKIADLSPNRFEEVVAPY